MYLPHIPIRVLTTHPHPCTSSIFSICRSLPNVPKLLGLHTAPGYLPRSEKALIIQVVGARKGSSSWTITTVWLPLPLKAVVKEWPPGQLFITGGPVHCAADIMHSEQRLLLQLVQRQGAMEELCGWFKGLDLLQPHDGTSKAPRWSRDCKHLQLVDGYLKQGSCFTIGPGATHISGWTNFSAGKWLALTKLTASKSHLSGNMKIKL